MEMEKLRHENEEEEEEEEADCTLLPGFRFHPTDQELVEFYLRRKVEKRPVKIDIIRIVDVYKYEPWDLPKVVGKAGEREWYFFCRRGRKYKNSIRPNRVTGSGFWKATGIDKPIYSVQDMHGCIGLKKSLVYYRGTAGKGTKTDWMMHEFRLPPAVKSSSTVTTNQEAEVWTLCRIFKREASHKKYTPDWKKSPPGQSYSDHSKISYSGSQIRNKYDMVDLCGDQSIERKPLGDGIHDGSQLLAGQFSLNTQHPFMASYLSLTNPSTNENFVDPNWDELRPMVAFALDQSMIYSLR